MLKEKGAKILRTVAAFLCKAEWINETAPKWTSQKIFCQLLPLKCGMGFDVSWKVVVFIVQSGLKLYDFSIVASTVENEQNLVVLGLEAADGMW